MQQYLIPHRIGDQRLLIPGWAGELSDPEVEFIQERLRLSRRLSRKWGIIITGAIANKTYARWPWREYRITYSDDKSNYSAISGQPQRIYPSGSGSLSKL